MPLPAGWLRQETQVQMACARIAYQQCHFTFISFKFKDYDQITNQISSPPSMHCMPTLVLSWEVAGGFLITCLTVCMSVSVGMTLTALISSTSSCWSSHAPAFTYADTRVHQDSYAGGATDLEGGVINIACLEGKLPPDENNSFAKKQMILFPW